jgi:hypothetical protein
MNFLKRRLATRRELFHAFVACSFPIFLWTFYRLFDLIPSWIIKLSLWEVVGVTAYILAYSLLESLLVWLIFVFVAALLPAAWFRERLVLHAAVMVWITAIWAVAIHLRSQGVYTWGYPSVLPWLVAYLLSILAAEFILWKIKILEVWIEGLVSRIAVLASVYVLTGLAGLLIAFVRNL